MPDSSPVTVLIPAYQEADRIADTVRAARALPGVARVLVVDDGSADDTAARAEAAGAEVLRLPANAGKGAALRAGLAALPGEPESIVLLLDADIGATAAKAARLLAPVAAGDADLAIARFPVPAHKGGFGLVKGLARGGTWLLTRQWLAAPISGQRACRRWVLDAAPIADGYGAEVAMNVAAGDAGARIVEVPVAMTHAATGRDLHGFRHRGRQFVHIAGALLAAAFGRTGQPFAFSGLLLWICAWLAWYPALIFPARPTPFQTETAAAWSLLGAMLPALAFGPLTGAALSGVLRARKQNFRGRFIPALGGMLLLPCCLVFLALAPRLAVIGMPGTRMPALFLPLFLLAWLLLGLWDDLRGDVNRKGFRGHLAALRYGRLTSGGVKLLGGGMISLLAAWLIRGTGALWIPTFLLSALVIALSANAMNLFDLRPGRALKVFWLAAFPLLIWLCLPGLHASAGIPLPVLRQVLLPVLLATLVYAPFDFAGMMMLGDTGANPLGALLGLYLAVLLPLPGLAAAAALLVLLHMAAERVSLTRIIERVPVLDWVDRLGR